MKNSLTIIAGLMIILVMVAGCQQAPPNLRPTQDNEDPAGENTKTSDFSFDYNPDEDLIVKSFETEEEFRAFLLDTTSSGGYYGGGVFRGDMILESAMDMAMPTAVGAAESNGLKAPTDYSETNVQVQGVDEGDIIKTDGNYIYTITEKTLFIVKAYPGEDAKVLTQIKFDNRPQGLFINDDKLTVFGDLTDLDVLDKLEIRARTGMSFLYVYDISDRNIPKLEKEFVFEGNYLNSRMVEDDVYLVTSVMPQYRIDPMPIIIEDDIARPMAVEDIHFFNIPYRNPYFVGINSISLENLDTESKMLAVEGYPNMYMSKENMFITYTERINEWELRQDILEEVIEPELPLHYKRIISKIMDTDPEVLNRYEKESKISGLYNEYLYGMSVEDRDNLEDKIESILKERLEEYKYREYTVVNKVSVENGNIRIAANGKVPGSVLNQFSMDEHDGILRIGTTVNPTWSRFSDQRTESTNNVYTLDKDLDIIGELEDLAEGERIFSTRFIGDKLYMVTFRQVDPFFVIDLSDPKNPTALGELKIPGFSRYLHPYDENVIIGIGRDATQEGRQQGLKISLFNVEDVKNPVEIAKYVSENRYSGTSAEYEHKAFLFSKEKNLLVIPVYSYNYDDSGDNYNGAFVFNIEEDEIELRGLIDHSKASSSRYWSPSVERSLYIENDLYTKSPYLLRINSLDDLSSIKDVELKPKTTADIPVY